MQIYDILEKDLHACTVLHQESFDKGWSEAEFVALYSNPHISGIYVADKGRMIGFLLYLHILDDAEIYTICVSKDDRKRGVATQILTALKSRLQERCAARIFLEVSEENDAAQALYEKNAFEIFDRRKSYYQKDKNRHDALMMHHIIDYD